MGIYFSKVIWCSRNVWYMTGIYHDYYWYIARIYCVSIHWGFIRKETMRLPPQVRTSMHRCIRRWWAARDPFQSMFYWAFIYDRYMSGILYMSYLSAGRFRVCFSCTPPALSGLPGLPSASVRFRPGLSMVRPGLYTDHFGFVTEGLRQPTRGLGLRKLPPNTNPIQNPHTGSDRSASYRPFCLKGR